MGKKMGRPLSGEEKLSHDLKVKIDDTTYNKLSVYSDKECITKAEAARRAIIEFLKKGE